MFGQHIFLSDSRGRLCEMPDFLPYLKSSLHGQVNAAGHRDRCALRYFFIYFVIPRRQSQRNPCTGAGKVSERGGRGRIILEEAARPKTVLRRQKRITRTYGRDQYIGGPLCDCQSGLHSFCSISGSPRRFCSSIEITGSEWYLGAGLVLDLWVLFNKGCRSPVIQEFSCHLRTHVNKQRLGHRRPH